jgi:preprotein translocase SecE subunit|tara:strand:- start:1448 stop:1630 length:183 start_codon:yes stop_codon:yes gene_type:complete
MISNFFNEIKSELGKISWIDKNENIKSTAGVVVVTIILGIILLIIDLIFSSLTEFLLGGM